MTEGIWIIRGHHQSCKGSEDCDCADEREPCECAAYDWEENDHTFFEHTRCGGSLHNGVIPCGGCDDCVSAQIYYAERRRGDV